LLTPPPYNVSRPTVNIPTFTTMPTVPTATPALPTTTPYIAGFVPPMIPPLTGRGSVYGCQCNMSSITLKDSLDKIQYALDSYLIGALTKSVLDGYDHDLLTVIACGLGGPNNANVKALSISEDIATDMCRQCEYSTNKKRSSNTPSVATVSTFPAGRRSRNVVPTPGIDNRISSQSSTGNSMNKYNPTIATMNNNPSISIVNCFPSTGIANDLPSTSTMNLYPSTPVTNGYPSSSGVNVVYPNRDVAGTNSVPSTSRTHSQVYPILT
ncbi:hypothetical protein BVRB_020580, partial [Beta vulgaris subsp. vulgaris]